MSNRVHRSHWKTVSPEAIVFRKPQLRHYFIDTGPPLLNFVILYGIFDMLDPQMSHIATTYVFFHVCFWPIIASPCLVCERTSCCHDVSCEQYWSDKFHSRLAWIWRRQCLSFHNYFIWSQRVIRRWGSLFAIDCLAIFHLKHLLHWQYSKLQRHEITVIMVSL